MNALNEVKNENEFEWVPSKGGQPLPTNAVYAGMDQDESQIFIGRARNGRDQLPVKIIPSKRMGYVSYGGREIQKEQYEVLCGSRFDWVACSNGDIHANAVEGGKTSSNEVLYIGRKKIGNDLSLGRIQPSHQCLYYPHNGEEQKSIEYEVLVQHPKLCWIRSISSKSVPDNAIQAGSDTEGSPIYIGSCKHKGDIIPAKVIPDKECAFISYSGSEIIKKDYDVLCNGNTLWMDTCCGYIPPNAIPGGKTCSGEILYIGRVTYGDCLIVGKIQPSHGLLYIAYGGKEIQFENYQILIEN